MTVADALSGATLAAGGDDGLGAGFIAFLVVLALCVAAYFLFRSMNRHLRNVPEHFDAPEDPGSPDDRSRNARKPTGEQ